MGILFYQLFRSYQAHLAQLIYHAGIYLLLAQVCVQAERLPDLPANLHDRIERSHRLLEYHGYLIALYLPQLLF